MCSPILHICALEAPVPLEGRWRIVFSCLFPLDVVEILSVVFLPKWLRKERRQGKGAIQGYWDIAMETNDGLLRNNNNSLEILQTQVNSDMNYSKKVEAKALCREIKVHLLRRTPVETRLCK